MTLGVVAWPDEALAAAVRRVWGAVDAVGCPSLIDSVQIPHVSFVVAGSLVVDAVASACGRVPAAPVPVVVSGVGVFPGGVVYLSLRPTEALLAEHRRIHHATRGLLTDEWSHYAPDHWVPHLTIATGLDGDQIGRAVPTAIAALPQTGVRGALVSGGIENGVTGERVSCR